MLVTLTAQCLIEQPLQIVHNLAQLRTQVVSRHTRTVMYPHIFSGDARPKQKAAQRYDTFSPWQKARQRGQTGPRRPKALHPSSFNHKYQSKLRNSQQPEMNAKIHIRLSTEARLPLRKVADVATPGNNNSANGLLGFRVEASIDSALPVLHA